MVFLHMPTRLQVINHVERTFQINKINVFALIDAYLNFHDGYMHGYIVVCIAIIHLMCTIGSTWPTKQRINIGDVSAPAYPVST